MPIRRNDYAERFRDIVTNNRVIGSVIYPKIEFRNSDIYIITIVNDRLDLLANKYYGTSNLWWILAHANKLGEGSFVIKPGTRLRVPQEIGKILDDLERINREV
tara:strand:+ start:157 stop:468 length:312 start_codon:yes stop_codon:yes gene_type:complete